MNKQKIIGLILGVVLFIAAIAGLTYAYVSWSSDSVNKVVSSKCFNVLYDKGSDINGIISPSADYRGGVSVELKMDFSNSCQMDASGKLFLETFDTTSSNLYKGALKYQILRNGVAFRDGVIDRAGVIEIDVGMLNKKAIATTKYSVYVWIDKSIITNDDLNSSYFGTVRAEAYQVVRNTTTLIEHIKNLYVSGNPTLITQENSGNQYYYSYQDNTNSWGLMNDGLKLSDEEGAGATIINDINVLKSGIEGNIRYFGPSDVVNNYIYFNCSDYSNQSVSTCEKWRIIGIVDGKVKIIREDSIGGLAWDQDKNQDLSKTTRFNDWSTSSLQLMLNGSYYHGDTSGVITYYSGGMEGTQTPITSTELNMTNIGIKNLMTRNLISKSIWYLGGYVMSSGLYPSVYPNQIYDNERTNELMLTIRNDNPYTISANIGLIYLSDYAYGSDLTKCNQIVRDYNSEGDSYGCRETNWIYRSNISQWVISPVVHYNGGAVIIYYNGSVGFSDVTSMIKFYPTLYLDTELTVNDGDGSSGDPYQIAPLEQIETEYTPLSDFRYELVDYSGGDIYNLTMSDGFSFDPDEPITLGSYSVLLTEYIGDSENVVIPDTYNIDGIEYNVVILSGVKGAIRNSGIISESNWHSLFLGNTKIKSVTFGEKVDFYNNRTNFLFADCTNLISVSGLSDTITNMGATFRGCTSLETAPNIPSSVTRLGSIFEGCSNLTGVVRINSSNVSFVDSSFYKTSKPIILEVPDGSDTMANFELARYNGYGIPDNVTIKGF